MTNNTPTDLLEKILKILDDALGDAKKKNRTAGNSNAPGGAGITNIKDQQKSMEVIGDTMKVLSSAIPPLAKISKKDYDTIAYGLKEIGQAVQHFALDKETLASVSNMLSAFVQIHNVITGLSENFMHSILSLNMVKAWILGKRLGRFYGIIAKAMTAEFTKQLVSTINSVPPNKDVDDKTFKQRMVNFGLLMAAILAITPKKIMQLWLMGRMLGPKTGANIGDFFKALVDKIAGGPGGSAKAQAAAKVALSIAAMIGTLTLCFIGMVIVYKKYSIEELIGGTVLLMGIITLGLGIIKILTSKWFNNKNTIKAHTGIYTIITLIGGLTLALAITIAVAKKNKWEDIAWGIVMLGAVVGFAILILRSLSTKTFAENALKGLAGIGSIVLLILGMTLALSITVNVAKDTEWSEIIKGITMLGMITVFALGVIWVLSRNTFQRNIRNGLLGVGAIVLLVVGLSGAMMLFIKLVNAFNSINEDDIWKTLKITGIMVGGVAALAIALGFIPKSVLILGGIAVGVIVGIIAALSGVLLLFTKLIKNVHELKQEDIKDAMNKILGKPVDLDNEQTDEDGTGMIGCLGKIIKSLSKFSVKAAVKVGIIGTSLFPVIGAISKFVDVIQKMASLKIANAWDKNGNPTSYIKLDETAFKTAATNLTSAFKTFLEDLSAGLNSFDANSLAIMQQLFPRQSGISKFFTGEKPGIGVVIRILSDFVDIIQKMASLSVPDKWDKDGKPISYRQLKTAEFGLAAQTLSEAFGTFLTELGTGLEKLSPKAAIVIGLLGDDLSAIMQSISSVFVPISQMAAGKILIGNETHEISLKTLNTAATDLVTVITTFVDNLKTVSSLDYDDFEDTFKCINGVLELIDNFVKSEAVKSGLNVTDIMNNCINPIIALLQDTDKINMADKNANSFEDAIEDFVDGVNELDKLRLNLDNLNNIKALTDKDGYLNNILSYINTISFFDGTGLKAKKFRSIMYDIGEGLNSISPYLKTSPAQIKDLAQALKALDNELLTKESQRTKAMQSIAHDFNDMSKSIDGLNIALSKSADLMKSYDRYKLENDSLIVKGTRATVNAVTTLADKAAQVFNHNKNEEQQKAIDAKKADEHKALAEAIGAAVSSAVAATMESWYESHKDLTVQFGEDGDKIFGTVFGQ